MARASVGFAGCLCLALGLGLGAAQADQIPDIPPPPPPADADPGGDGSAGGYPNASENQAESLFTTEFSSTVSSLAADPADLGPNARYLDAHTALVAPGAKSPAEFKDAVEQILAQNQGDIDAARSELDDLVDAQNAASSELISATLPLRTPNDAGQQAPVDLALDPEGTGYVPDNPLVDLKLPNSLANDVAVGDDGIKVDVGATEAAAADGISGGDNLFYHEATTDTDVVLAPLSVGFETLYQLRSPQSPEQLEMSFTLPAGASLQASDGGAAAIVKDGDTLATVSAPVATDAAGEEVDVTTSVSGDSLELDVAHQNADVAYPINVDPVFDVYTGANGGIGAFSTDWSDGQTSGSAYQMGTTCVQNVSCTSGNTGPRGLYIHAPTNQTYSAGQAANWVYLVPHWAPSTAYISELVLGPMDYDRHSGTATNPYFSAGILSSNLSWLANYTQTTDMDDTYWMMGPPTNNTTGKVAVFQLYTPSTVSITHWRHAFLGGARIGLSDTENATETIDTDALTSDWLDGNDTVTFPVNVADGGLGVKGIYGPGPDGNSTLYFTNQGESCQGTRTSPCPQSGQKTFGYYPGKTPEGQSVSTVRVWDALGKGSVETWNIRVDRSPPQISTSGGLSPNGTGNPYTLHVGATDGNASNPASWRSGVQEIQVQLNGHTVADTGPQDCVATASSCPLSLDYAPDLLPLATDHFTVIATDELGYTQTKEWSIVPPGTLPVDSSPPMIDLGGGLPEDPGETLTSPSYDLRVDATDGDTSAGNHESGVKSIEILVDGQRKDFAEQSCPAGGCSMEREWTFNTPDYGLGNHTAAIIATDQLGHQATAHFTVTVGQVEAPPPDLTPDTLPCTGASEPPNFQAYSLGTVLAALPVTNVDRRCDTPDPGEPVRANYVSYIYGDCVVALNPNDNDTGTGCAPPIEIQTWPACERSLADYQLTPDTPYPHDDLGSRDGVPAFSFDGGGRIELYTGSSTIVLFADDPALLTLALAALRAEPIDQPPELPLSNLSPVTNLPPPVPGAIEGTLSCSS